MGNALQFSPGLTTASFLNAAKGTTGALAALAGVGLGLGGGGESPAATHASETSSNTRVIAELARLQLNVLRKLVPLDPNFANRR